MSWTEQDYQRHLAKFTDPHGPAKTPSRELYEKAVATPVKRQKFNAQKTSAHGKRFDSKKEAARWQDLELMHAAGQIACLMPHPSFPVYVNGVRTGRFTGDSLYIEHGRLVVEDVKSGPTKTTAWTARVKVFRACYPQITFRVWPE